MNERLGIFFLIIQVLTIIAGIIGLIHFGTENPKVEKIMGAIYMILTPAMLSAVCIVGCLYNMGVIG